MPISNPPPVGARLTVAETEVFNGTAPTTWTDLDLSSVVGPNPALVILKTLIEGNDATYAFRKDGDTDEQYDGGAVLHGAGMIFGDTLKYQIAIVVTNALGIIEWKASSPFGSQTVDIIGFIK